MDLIMTDKYEGKVLTEYFNQSWGILWQLLCNLIQVGNYVKEGRFNCEDRSKYF